MSTNAPIQRARDWLSFASPRESGWALIRDLAAEIDNLVLQNEACGNALVDSQAENEQLRAALEAFFVEYDGDPEWAQYAPSDATEVLMREAVRG